MGPVFRLLVFAFVVCFYDLQMPLWFWHYLPIWAVLFVVIPEMIRDLINDARRGRLR